MKTLWIHLVMTIGLCGAKGPPNNRFPDFLAPLRGMFGSSRGNHGGPPYQAAVHDSTGAETGRPPVPGSHQGGGDEHTETFRPYFPSSFAHSPYDESGGERRLPFKPEGRVLSQFQGDSGIPQQFSVDHRPPPIQFSPESRHPSQFPREKRPLFQYGPGPEKRSPQFHPHVQQINPESRPSQQFHPEGRPPVQFSSEERFPSQFSPSEGRQIISPQFSPESSQFRRPTRHHRQQLYQPSPPHEPLAPEFLSETPPQNLHDEKSTGFSDFTFSPVEFDRSPFGSSFGNEAPAQGSPHSGGGDRPPFRPSKPVLPFGGARSGQPDFQESPRSLFATREREALGDLQKGSSGKGEPYFDDIYRQPSGHLQLGPPIGLQAEQSRILPGSTRSPPVQNFRPTRENSEFSNIGKDSMLKQKPPGGNEVHYGKPLVIGGVSTNLPTIVPLKEGPPKTSDSVPSPSFYRHRAHAQAQEPMTAASVHGSESYGAGGGGGDRILYHVSGHAGPTSYRFGYDTGSGYNRMFRHEEKDGEGLVKGKYGFHDKTGKLQVINYSAHPTGGFHSERAH